MRVKTDWRRGQRDTRHRIWFVLAMAALAILASLACGAS
jgi:hypothetical protein